MPYIQNIPNFLETIYPHGVSKITLHWTAAPYDRLFADDYHFQITSDGQIWLDERAFDQNGNFVPLSHSWHDNSRNIGISICGMFGAVEPVQWSPKDLYDFPKEYGQYPPTQIQMDTLCTLTSALVRKFGLTFDKVKSHYDEACEFGYSSERWEWKWEMAFIRKRIQDIYNVTNPSI